jgi:predicted HAD superfamily phosphohydrolase YqeG
MTNGRILLLDLDETLIHAKYVNHEEDATFKLILPENGMELLVRNFQTFRKLTFLGEAVYQARSKRILAQSIRNVHSSAIYSKH